MAGDKKHVHFGHYLRFVRTTARKKVRAFAQDAGITEKRLIDIEKMPEPQVNETTLQGLADAAGMTREELEKKWQSTPVSVAKLRRAGVRSGERIIRVSADTYSRLQYIADEAKLSVDAYLAAHALARTRKVKITPPHPPSAAGDAREAHAHQQPQ